MPKVVVYDACVLHPAPLRDLLIRLARAGLVRAHWAEAIINGCFRSILRRRPDLETPLKRTRALMNVALPDALITGYEDLIDTLDLPDPDDRHVLAAAIRAEADVIVTANLADSPPSVLGRYAITAKHPDELVAGLVDSAPAFVLTIVKQQASDLRNPPRTVDENAGSAEGRRARNGGCLPT